MATSDRHRQFDDGRLFARKKNFNDFRFCPRTGDELVEKVIDNHHRLVCPNPDCDYVFYQNPIPAAGAIVVEDGRILLVKRAHPPKVGWWCIPAGFMEWDEHPTQTAVREVKEETGLDIVLTGFFDLYSGTDDPRTNAILILYHGKVVGGELEAQDDALEVRYFEFGALPADIAFVAHRQALSEYRARFLK